MIAHLETACGCQGRTSITWPPPRRLFVALNYQLNSAVYIRDNLPPEMAKKPYREFELAVNHGPAAPAIYREVEN